MRINCLDPSGVEENEKIAHQVLEASLPETWRGYASLQMYGRQSAEFDLIILSPDRIIVAEIKSYDGDLFQKNDRWVIQSGDYEGYRTNGLKQVVRAAKILAGTIKEKLQHKTRTPYIDCCVVLCGTANANNLPSDVRDRVFTLEEFKNIGNPKFFEKSVFGYRRKYDKEDRPNNNIDIWDKFFLNNSANFKPKKYTFDNYAKEGSAIFQHKNKIYSEYKSFHIENKNYQAVMRCWDFSASSIQNLARTPEERKDILLRESKVLGFIDNQNNDLKQLHLEYKPSSGSSTDFNELYEWPTSISRLDEFIEKKWKKISKDNRINLTKVFISRLSELHRIKVAHRDIGNHSVWLGVPTKVVFSNFVAASYPDIDNKTVKSIRGILTHGRIVLPEDLYEDPDGTPYTRDVFLAASVAHYLIFGFWPSKQDEGIYEWHQIDNDPFNGIFDAWFSKALDFEAKNRFQDLTIALEELNELTLDNKNDNKKSLQDFEKYYTEINIFNDYAPIESVSVKGTVMLYKANNINSAIKVWNGVSDTSVDGFVNNHLLMFLNRIQNIKNSNISGVTNIRDFGFNPSFQHVFVSYDWIDGECWGAGISNISSQEASSVALKLLKTTALLHKNKISHGDIHPENIILHDNNQEVVPILIDLFDFFDNEKPPYTQNYVPNNYEGLSLFSIDRYAIVKIVEEMPRSFLSENLHEYCSDLINQSEVSEGDLNRLIDNYHDILNPKTDSDSELEQFVLSVRNFPDTLTEIESVDGTYFINFNKIETDRVSGERVLKVFFSGAREKMTMKIGIDNRSFFSYAPKKIRHDELMRDKKNAKAILSEIRVYINQGWENEAKEFVDLILNNSRVQEELSKLDLHRAQEEEVIFVESSIKDPIGKIWKKIMDTEYVLYPKITLTGEPEKLGNGDLSATFSLEQGSLGFDISNESVKIKKEFNDYLSYFGRVVSFGGNVIRYKPVKAHRSLEFGDEVILENSLAASSLSKRREALEEIINNRCVIPNLVDYFDPNLDCQPSESNMPLDDELETYTEYDKNGKIIFKLNSSQKEAFKKLYMYGPLGLLQGPPGTGKTAFIGTFIHYSINKGAKSVLLVSQSHEAVNNAAEKARELFNKKDQEISIVRLGDDEKISEPLEDVTESSIQNAYRDLFKAEIIQRIKYATESFSVSDAFIKLSVEFELSFAKRADSFLTQLSLNDTNSNKEIKKKIDSLLDNTSKFFLNNFNESMDISTIDLSKFRDKFYHLLSEKFEIDSPAKIEKYRNILQISFEWLSVMSSSNSQFQNFLTKTRTLVCGTCVGIARKHYGINENIYDLVIIDEAARATAGEMAIAMQVGKKVILVGDHKQLPPQMEDEHINAVMKELDNIDVHELRRSDFERAFLSNYGKIVGQRLSIQYRMALPIGKLVSQCFYEGCLETGRGAPHQVFDNLPENLGKVVTWIDTSKEGTAAYDRHPNGRNSNEYSFVNLREADLIIQLIQKLVDTLPSDSFFDSTKSPEIGVICMYKEQKILIENKIRSLGWARQLIDNASLMIDTVDGYQGKENSIIIVSLVRNNKEKNEGFLSSVNRINVALSRAKERLYIFGAADMWLSKNSNSPIGTVLSFIKEHSLGNYAIIDSNSIKGE